jgi:ankyrin repeat protein
MNFQYFCLEKPLHRSAFFGDRAALKYFLDLGEDINLGIDLSREHNSFLRCVTPLMLAAWSTAGASVETLRWLVEHGANPHIKSAAKVTAAWYSISNPWWWDDPDFRTKDDRFNRLEYLLGLGIDPTKEEWEGRTLLTEACEVGDPNCVSLLINANLTVSASTPSNEQLDSEQIPLFCAARSGSADCVRLLLKAGAGVNIRDFQRRTALMYAKSIGVLEVLLKAGIDLHAIDLVDGEEGHDALFFILEDMFNKEIDSAERLTMASCLISAGLDIEKKDDLGNTRLFIAAFNGNEFAVNFLLDQGANPYHKSSDGSSPLHGVCWGSDMPFHLDWQPCQKQIRIIERLLEAEIDINIRDDMGWAPIHEAVVGDGGNLNALKTLLKYDADPNVLTHENLTPLMLAAMEGELECMQTLLAAGADLTISDSQDWTAAAYAIEHYEKLNEEGNTKYEGSLDYLLQRASECIWLLK